MSSPTPESPRSGKKHGLRKRLLRFFSRTEDNFKEHPRTRSEEEGKSPSAVESGHLVRKGRSWSERLGRKDRQETQEGQQSLPRLRNQKPEEAILRRASRESKTRSLSYSELELPTSSFLQRFGSLTWRKKRFSVLEYSNATPNASTPIGSQWSVGRLERPAVGSELDLESRRPQSCIAEYSFPQLTPKNSERYSKREHKTLEVSTSFDCVADDDGDHYSSSSQETTKGKNVQLPFPFPERLEGEDEEESLPCWAESIFQDYISQDHHSPGSVFCPLSTDSDTLEAMAKHEKPDQYRSPLYHRMSPRDLLLEEVFINESQEKSRVFSAKHIPQVNSPNTSSICIQALRQNKESDVQHTLSCKGLKIKETEKTTPYISLYTSILSQDVEQIRAGQKWEKLSQKGQKNPPNFPDMPRASTAYYPETKSCNSQISLAHEDNIQDGLHKKTMKRQKILALKDPFQDQIENIQRQTMEHELAQSVSESFTVSQETMKDDCEPQASPNAAKIRYEVIVTMTKEEKEQDLLPKLALQLVKAEELVGLDLRMSPSLESQACGCNGAGPAEVTAQEILESSEQTEKNTTQEEEIPEKERGGETSKGAQWDRSNRSTVDEEFLFNTSGFDQVADSCRLHSTNMEKPDTQQSFSELPRSSKKKENVSIKLSHSVIPSQLHAGHVKGLQKVFENISSKDVIHHKVTDKSQQCGSLREKKHRPSKDGPVTPGVHGPVYSKVYNPLGKDNLDKSDCVTGTALDSSEKSNTTVSLRNADSNEESVEIKATKKYIANVELFKRHQSDNEANNRKAKIQLPDLKLPPRASTPPPYRTKNNVSISLSSPRGWKNESVILRSPMSSVAQRFENQRLSNYYPVPSQPSGTVFFSGQNFSHAKLGLETQQNVTNYTQIQPKNIPKNHIKNNPLESSKSEGKPWSLANNLHDISHIANEKKYLHNRSFERFTNTTKNEIQEDSTANEEWGLKEKQGKFTDKHIAEIMSTKHINTQGMSTSKILQSRSNEACVEKHMNTSIVDLNPSHDIPSVLTHRNTSMNEIQEDSIGNQDSELGELQGRFNDKHTVERMLIKDTHSQGISTAEILKSSGLQVCVGETIGTINSKLSHDIPPVITKIQEDSVGSEESRLGEMYEILTDKHIAEFFLADDTHYPSSSTSEILKSREKEVCVDKNMNTCTIDSKLSHDIPPVINQRRKPPDHSPDTYINHKVKNSLREKLEDSNDNNNHGASCFMDINYVAVDSMAMSNDNRDDIFGDLCTNKEVKSKPPPTIILRTVVHKVNHDSIDVNKSKNNDELIHDEALVINQPPEEEIKLKHKVEELKNKHAALIYCEYNIEKNVKSNTDAPCESQSTTVEDQANSLTGQGEEVSIEPNKCDLTMDLKTYNMGSTDNIKDCKTNVLSRADDKVNSVPLNDKEIESYIEQPKIGIPEKNNGFVQNKTIDKKEEEETGEDKEMDLGFSNHEQQDLVSVTTNDRQIVNLLDTDQSSRVLRTIGAVDILGQPECEIAELTDQSLGDGKDKSTLVQDKSEYEQNTNSNDLLSMGKLDQVLHMDSHINAVGTDIVDHGKKLAVSVETEGIPEKNNGFVLNKTIDKKEEGKTGEVEEMDLGFSNHKQHDLVSVTTNDRQIVNLLDTDRSNRVLRTIGAVDILGQPECEIAELTDQSLGNGKDISTLVQDKSEYEQNSNDLLSMDKLDQVLHMDSHLNAVGTDIVDHGTKFAVSVETEGKQMEKVSVISKNSTVVKKTVNMIQENTTEVEIKTVGMKDQSILDATVAKDEPATNTTNLFASDLTVNTEESKELIKTVDNKDQEAQGVILVYSPSEINEQPFNNLKEESDNLSDTNVSYQNTTQTSNVIVDHKMQSTDIISEHHEIGAEQTLDIINPPVDTDVIGKTVVGSEDAFSIFSNQDKYVVIKKPVVKSVGQNGDMVLGKAEQPGNISLARECLAVEYGNSAMEHKFVPLMGVADQGTMSHPDDPQNIPDTLLIENSSLKGEEKENYILNEINQHISAKEVTEEPSGDVLMDQVEQVVVMPNKCLEDQTEDAEHEKEKDGIDHDIHEGKLVLDISDEIHELSKVKILDDILSSTNVESCTDDAHSKDTQMSKNTANHVTDEVGQQKRLEDNLLLNEARTDSLIDESPTVILHDSAMQTALQQPKANLNFVDEGKNVDTVDSNIYWSVNKLNGDVSGLPLSYVDKINDTTDIENMSTPTIIYPQEKKNSVQQMTEIVQLSHLPKSEKDMNESINSAEEGETESLENMESWMNKLRQLETPQFVKQLREPRQPRCSALSMYATLPPIKEDQGSPKSFDFRLPFLEINEKKNLPEESKPTVEPTVAEQPEKSEQGEKKYSWERSTERSIIGSSPLQLMRKHSGDEVSRSDSYKALIAQNLSQRQGSIIGSLLLSERLDKKTDPSERKSFSRIESSILLSSYMKPQKDKPEVTEETKTISENATPESDTATTVNDTLTSTTEDPQQEDSIDSSIPKVEHVTEIDLTELPPKLETSESSPLKVFPDVWHHPEKSHGKLNPRPGKIILFSEPGFRGHSYELYSDVGNTCEWELQGTISVRIIRGGWLLYEKPNFRGRRAMLSEGGTDLTCPWGVQDKSTESLQQHTEKPKSWIGSLRHVVRDFQIPRISLFKEENGEGNKITILGATPDLCVNGQPIKTESIIVHSGLWLVYNKPFFEGDPYILESGGYPNKKAWNGHDSILCSLQPALIGGPTVEKPNEPKILLFQDPDFEGHTWEVTRDLHSIQGEPNQMGERLSSVGAIKVLGGCWVAYEKEGFRGHQYLLEEGEYQDWSKWGGCTKELGSLRHIRTDLSEPEIILYKKPGCLEGSCLRLNEALADIEVAQYGTNTGSIQVLNGVWVAYENVDFSGEQYILEKGIYHSYQDWGAKNSQICSVQPVLQVGGQSLQYLPKIQLFSEPNFHGDCMTHTEDRVLLPKSFLPQSCRIEGGSWILYEGEDCCGEQYILVEGDYPTRTAMGCQLINIIRSLEKVPLYFSIPSISLHGLERFEGKELEFTGAVRSLQGEGYNNHVLSIKVASGIWVLYEHNDFRGRQWLLERTQITNWLMFSGIQRIGSLCPIRQRRVYFRLRNRAMGLLLCVPEPVENMKAARVQVTEPREGSCDLWYYEEGRIKNQMTPQMSLQVVGMTTPGTKVVMWSEGRKPIQTWSLEDSGLIKSCLFEGLCLDIKGGHSFDSDHVVVWETEEDRLTQRWSLEVF
ncbi:beta/gamma crystallin domain-containing protein 2 [Hyla sarda]|uniref:beta/gamma crystallin domain-containing protein 2 n=1 Tax=Hyla sarda TaxID=327740 RepID=UPI0024C3B0B6|nr:beta/gamma crystallin domain-containing protein 2 [Hyla sarda]